AKVLVGLAHSAAQPGPKLIQQVAGAGDQSGRGARNGSQIAIAAPGVADVAEAAGEREIGSHLPGITDVRLHARIKLPAGRQPEFGFLGEKALAIPQEDGPHWVIQRIGITSGERSRRRNITRCAIEARADGRGKSKELRKASAQDAVDSGAVTNNVRSIDTAPVILELLVGLERRLGSQNVWP